MDLSRRGFLKACAVVPAGMLVIPKLDLLAPEWVLAHDQKWIATVRELAAFDIYSNRYMLRFDILGPTEQCGIGFVVDSERLGKIKECREIAADKLRDEMIRRGWTLADLRPLPIPAGYELPEWVRAA